MAPQRSPRGAIARYLVAGRARRSAAARDPTTDGYRWSSDETAALFANLGLKPLVEITLVWVLFSDAARIRIQDFRHGLGLYVRLLAVGLPLTVVAGWGLAAWWLLPGLGVWLALLVGAALAPTDAALGLPVVTNPAVPPRSDASSPSRAASTMASRPPWSCSPSPERRGRP